jgi:hypothetical protein
MPLATVMRVLAWASSPADMICGLALAVPNESGVTVAMTAVTPHPLMILSGDRAPADLAIPDCSGKLRTRHGCGVSRWLSAVGGGVIIPLVGQGSSTNRYGGIAAGYTGLVQAL